ncbi:MAG: capsular polysaccharide biosynthesis protein, partial [Pseudomonadota bacterium]
IDQTFGDASVAGAGAHAGHFQTMLDTARAEHPGATILIKTHPETLAGKRAGFFDPRDGNAKTLIWDHGTAPRALFARARAVYCVSSLLGAEAILHGHRPVVFGDAFYCGRGLTDDRHERTPARTPITPEAFFDAAYLRYCRWHDPALGRLCTFEDVLDQLTSKMSAHKGFAVPSVLSGMRLWKRGFLKRRFDRIERFEDDPKTASRLADHAGGQIVVWAGKESTALTRAAQARKVPVLRMEDGFVRSAGLGAELVVPASLTLDDAGIYYDPSRPSRLERLIDAGRDLPPWAETRARRLADRIVAAGVSKYNLGAEAPLPEFPEGRDVVLVPGQVEDDQSILKGAPGAATNRALLAAARGAFPGAYIVYKPHPDVLAGLRDGGESGSGFADADETVARADIAQLLPHVSRVATMTSLTGFEALLRGIPVTTWGIPFYAGWGLTDDRAETPARRRPGVPLWALVHAALIDYPAYWDPVTGLSCGPEVLLERLETGAISRAQGPGLRLLAKAQGLAASYAYLWR